MLVSVRQLKGKKLMLMVLGKGPRIVAGRPGADLSEVACVLHCAAFLSAECGSGEQYSPSTLSQWVSISSEV